MITNEVVQTEIRAGGTKNAARRVRVSGKIPAVVYGAGKASIPVIVDPKQIVKILHSKSGHNTIFDVNVGGENTKVMIVDWQYEPIKGSLMHIDMKRIAMDKTIRVKVPVQLTGVAEGVKTQGGILDQILREVEIECLPGNIPGSISVDVAGLIFGQVLRVVDLPPTEGVKFLTDGQQAVAHITTVKEEAPAVAAVADVSATTAEPEVIKKGKTDEAEAPAKGGDKGKK